VVLQVSGEIGRGRVRVVAADGVEDGDSVLRELLGSSFQGRLSLCHQATLFTVFLVGELHSAVADGASAVAMKNRSVLTNLGGDLHALAFEETLVATDVANDLHLGGEFAVTLDESANGRGETGGKPASSQEGDFVLLFSHRGARGLAELGPFAHRGALSSVDLPLPKGARRGGS